MTDQDDDDLATYLKELAATPVDDRREVSVVETALPPLMSFVTDPPVETTAGVDNGPGSSGSTGDSTGIGDPTEEGKYDRSVDSEGSATWTFDTVPNAPLMVDGFYGLQITGGVATWMKDLPPVVPDATLGVDSCYVLRRNSSSPPEWLLTSTVDVVDCSSGSSVTYKVLALPPTP